MVRVERVCAWWRGFGLFHWPAPSWANFSNLQTVWAQAQGSEAKGLALQDSRLISLLDTLITSGTAVPDTLFPKDGNLSHRTKRTRPLDEEGGRRITAPDETKRISGGKT